ncbi:hypothetical protein DPMN_061611 [Dreissena polymorpha]|uniref:Uncharacterized protein n=1 Tax=Dreissena polymorpha TaxID=45954 RepID=A0A9D4HHB8_DREPO|nr:hypothetical protein DPMN_061611 [Dreissena polymorpha]
MEPLFRKKIDGQLVMTDTLEARTIKAKDVQWMPARKAVIVKDEAVELCKQSGGDFKNQKHVMGCFKIEFGQFRGKTFKWLLENSPGYAGFIVADTEKDEPSHNKVYANKMALKKYMELFEEGVQMINSKRQSKPKEKVSPTSAAYKEMTDEELLKEAQQIETEKVLYSLLETPDVIKTQTIKK